MPKEQPRDTGMDSKKLPVRGNKANYSWEPVGLEDNRNSRKREKENIQRENKTLKRRNIKVTKKPIDYARLFDIEGQDLKALLKG